MKWNWLSKFSGQLVWKSNITLRKKQYVSYEKKPRVKKSVIKTLAKCNYTTCLLSILLSITFLSFFFQAVRYGAKRWISSYWNIWDAIVIVLFFLAFGLRAGGLLIQGRITYAIDLMLFIVRILEIFYVDRTLGPYVVMIGKMVSSPNISIYLLSKIDIFLTVTIFILTSYS